MEKTQKGQWVRCTPNLINAGVSCAHTPRRAGDGTYSHDHWISHVAPVAAAAPAAVLDQLRSRIKEMQEAAYTFGDYSKEAVSVALDGVLEAIDELPVAAAAPGAVPDVVGTFEAWWNGRGMSEGLKPAFYMAWKAALNVE